MSADLELFQDLGKLKLPKLKIQSSTQNGISIVGENKNLERESECVTPTGEENKIPESVSCPPAPRKPKKKNDVRCKRKLSELEFFEIIHRDEVNDFFKAVLDDSNSKRRCSCT